MEVWNVFALASKLNIIMHNLSLCDALREFPLVLDDMEKYYGEGFALWVTLLLSHLDV